MIPDTELLRRYVDHHDQSAFRAWVELRINLVYSVALRVLNGDTHLAQDVAQHVFTDAARHASRLVTHPAPSAWLFTSTRFAAAKFVRTQQRRRQRELSAAMNHLSNEASVDWEAVRPILDEVLADLPATDRDAIIQRYFERADYAAIGEHLNLTANAARMRVDRALDKLSAQLRRRGVTSTATALSAVLGTQALTAAPVGLAATISATALTPSALTAVSLLAMSQAPLIATAVVVAIGVTFIAQETSQRETLRQSRAASLAVAAAVAAVPPPTAPPHTAAAVSDADYTALEHEVSSLQSRLVDLDRAAVSRLQRPALHGRIYNLKELDVAPKPSKQVPPKYPTEMRQQGVTGRAVISMTIDGTGAVRDLLTVSTSEEVFAEAALEAVSQWQFEPGQLAGLAVNTKLQVPIIFDLSNEPHPIDDWF